MPKTKTDWINDEVVRLAESIGFVAPAKQKLVVLMYEQEHVKTLAFRIAVEIIEGIITFCEQILPG
ncbi:hypothetical protein ABA45_13805 [Marinobacter psychrophilus]|uniref:Uncharacterized protein n=2 Tax=Marinobacter psychrophilus TaxID=330734 RepID=A0A0H4I6H2_9GAMM|nr:hypothetical protein ABA45_13805 [Marinobacter psychrophilus]